MTEALSPPLLIRPEWPASARVQAISTTRQQGGSPPPWDSFNLGDHVGDDPRRVKRNRERLKALTGAVAITWLEQVHGTAVLDLDAGSAESRRADAATTSLPGQACAILTADCLPVLICDLAGTRVAAAHAGWRGLAAGVLESTLARFENPDRVLAWLGPAIGPAAFEVGPEVRDLFTAQDAGADACFQPSQDPGGRLMADLYELARRRLRSAGVTAIFGGTRCTFGESESFFSYRRDGQTGRQASLIWLSH